MAQVIAKAIRDRERPMPRDVVAMLDGHRLVLRRRESARIIERTRARRGTHNERRPYVAGLVIDHFRREYQRALVSEYRRDRARLDADLPRLPVRDRQDGGEVAVAAALVRGERPPPEWEQELTARLRRVPEVRAALERMWPVLSGAELVNDLFGFAALIRSAADDDLTPAEQRAAVPGARRRHRCGGSGPTPTSRSSTKPMPSSGRRARRARARAVVGEATPRSSRRGAPSTSWASAGR